MTCVVLQTIMVKMYNPTITKPLSVLGVGVETLYVPYLNIILSTGFDSEVGTNKYCHIYIVISYIKHWKSKVTNFSTLISVFIICTFWI